MPAASERDRHPAGRTTVFRPRRARRVIYSCIALVLLVFLGANLWLPADGPDAWGLGSRVALGLLAWAIAYFLHRLAAVRVVADDEGAEVVNIVHRRRLEWPEIIGVRLELGDPWLVMDLSDGESLAAMGVQRSEGAFAQRQAAELARMVNDHTRAAQRPPPPPAGPPPPSA